MRLWTLHPRYLDRQGLLALWREGLLAAAVLRGATRGYRSHPQLRRFAATASPPDAIAAYLHAVADEASARGYRFDRAKLELDAEAARVVAPLTASDGQIQLERRHLAAKLATRCPERLGALPGSDLPDAHPLFVVVPGPVAEWERAEAP